MVASIKDISNALAAADIKDKSIVSTVTTLASNAGTSIMPQGLTDFVESFTMSKLDKAIAVLHVHKSVLEYVGFDSKTIMSILYERFMKDGVEYRGGSSRGAIGYRIKAELMRMKIR